MSKGNQRPLINTVVWEHIKYKFEKDAPYRPGQILRVHCKKENFDYIPCMPKPLVENPIFGLTKIPNDSMIMYCGIIELAENVSVMHFIYNLKNHILLGMGIRKHLMFIPASRNQSKINRQSSKKKKTRLTLLNRQSSKKKKTRLTPLLKAKLQRKNRLLLGK